MKNSYLSATTIFFVFIIFLLNQIIFPINFGLAEVANKENLKAQIDAKTLELQKINREILEQRKKIEETQLQKNTLSSELKKINADLKEIELNIYSSQVTLEKLELEMDSLQKDISQAEKEIELKGKALGEVLRQLQQKEEDNLLLIFLRNKTLSEGISDVQSLYDINSNILISINELKQAKDNLNSILEKTAAIKTQKEIEHQNLKNKKIIADEIRKEKAKFLEETKNKEKIYQAYLKELEERQLAIALEIEKMEAQLRTQINYKNLPQQAPGFLSLPLATFSSITQDYGATKFAQRAYRGKWHNGLDFAAPLGTPVYAAQEGIVVAAENQDRYCYKGAYGKYVAIRHYSGLTTLYAHLSLYVVKEGEKVERGQIIGYVGSTGYATGPHLHFTVYDSSTFRIDNSKSCGPKMPYGGDINPRNYLAL